MTAHKAADLGVKAGDVATALNTFAAGQRVTTFSQNNKQYDVVLQADEKYRRDRNNLQYFTVASTNGGTVGLEKLIKIEDGMSPSSISRLNRQRQITVNASLPPNSSESDAVAKLETYVKEFESADRIYGGRNGTIERIKPRVSIVFVCVFVVVRFYVSDSGGAVRIVYSSGHDSSDLAAFDSVRARFDLDCRTDSEYFFRARNFASVRNRQEKRDFAD